MPMTTFHKAGDSAYGLFLLGGRALLGVLAVIVVAAGAWVSWDSSARHVMVPDQREKGVVTLVRCGDTECTGSFAAAGKGGEKKRVTIRTLVTEQKGTELPVVVKPGTNEVLRAGGPGLFQAWIPLGGGLLLASVVVGGGMRFVRTAWSMAAAGALLLLAAYLTMSFG